MFNRSTLIVLAIAAAFAGLLAGWFYSQRPSAQPTLPTLPALQSMKHFETPRVLPPIQLTRHDGQPLDNGAFKGHWTLVFIGFTHCPDVCPTTLAQMAQAQKQWRTLPDSTRPRLLFVSVDPERDTPDGIGEYAHGFDPDTLAATADIPALEAFAKSLSLVFAKSPAPEGAPADQYSVDHSAAIAVLDPQARMAGVIQPPLDPQAIAKDMSVLTGMPSR